MTNEQPRYYVDTTYTVDTEFESMTIWYEVRLIDEETVIERYLTREQANEHRDRINAEQERGDQP
jgi:hypothetical protein